MRVHSNAVEEHAEVPHADGGEWEQQLERCRSKSRGGSRTSEDRTRSYVVSVYRSDGAPFAAARMREILGLVDAQGDDVVGSESLLLSRVSPKTWLRRGVAEGVGERARQCGADQLVLDAELSPSQTRNLEDLTGLPISDREAVILNVFERHAATPRSRVQVEIAHLSYLRPRIRGIGLDMDQQAGGLMGSRGPGETASELFARRLDSRLHRLRRSLERLERSDRARQRRRKQCTCAVLVGYTNAGKTSLMNALCATELSARDRPFETLETTSRCLTRHGGDVLLSDTVGFIRELPERLFASFASTLEEVRNADLLLVVVDASDPERAAHLRTTVAVLRRLGANEVERLVVFNKIDRLPDGVDDRNLERLSAGHPYIAVSSRDPTSAQRLREVMLTAVRRRRVVREVFVRYENQAVLQAVYARCRILKSVACERGTQLLIEGAPRTVARIATQCRKDNR